jgi:hypothetical protein
MRAPSISYVRPSAAVLVVLVSLATASCDMLRQKLPDGTTPSGFSKPSVVFESATLVEAPSQTMMQAYYCPQVVPNPFGVPGAAAEACRRFFGPPPSKQSMRVSFDLKFRVHNPNNVPVPLAEILTAATVFPRETQQNLGAVCVRLCAEGDATCTGGPDPNGCRASSSDIRSMEDFQQAAFDFLLAQGLALAAGEKPTFVAPKVATSGDLSVTVRFSFGPEALLQTLHQVAKQAVSQLEKGQAVTFQIPYRLEGTVWVDAGSFGRVAVSFGPAEGTWTLPTEKLSLPL